MSSLRVAAKLAALALTAGFASAQLCPNPSQTTFQNDNLPLVPGGSPLTVSVIPGLCEGEAIGAVFDLGGVGTPQPLTQVSVGYGAPGGAVGFAAEVNVEIYDGVTFSGGIPILGPKVFDLNQDQGVSIQVTSTGFNALDMSQFGVEVGNGTDKFVVAFRMNLNDPLSGNCAGGFNANFFTDNSQFGLTCNPVITPPEKNLIDIQGQGWRDVTQANVSGFPLCPLFIAGNWAVRACTDPGSNPIFIQAAGNPSFPGGVISLTFNAPGYEGRPMVAACAFSTDPGIVVETGQVFPLNFDALFQLSWLAPTVFIGFFNVIGPAGTVGGAIVVPPDPVLSGFSWFTAFAAVPGVGDWGISDPVPIVIQ